jgi:hypothetical protein
MAAHRPWANGGCARGGVGARGVEAELALEPDHAGEEADKLRDGDVATDADIDGVDSLVVPDAHSHGPPLPLKIQRGNSEYNL